jgi:FG-GAP-like repeat
LGSNSSGWLELGSALRSHPEPAISEKNNERTKHTKTKTNIIHLALALFAFAYFALMPGPKAFAVVPPPDGGHSNGNMAEGVSNSVEISGPSRQAPASLLTLDNGTIKVGLDTLYGGGITYLSQSGSTTNLINIDDFGREVQQSYYSGPANFVPPGAVQNPNWSPWGWNSSQIGDSFGYRAAVLAYSNSGGTIYVKTRPMQWALRNYPGDCIMEQWTRLDGPAVRVHCKLTNQRADHTQYPPYDQELPAAYGVGPLCHIFSYIGTAPFTGGALTQLPNAPPTNWASWRATENWSAMVNSSNFGFGVHNPDAISTLGGYENSGNPCTGGPTDDNTGYIAPTHIEVLDYNIVYEYDFNLIVGTLTSIRSWVYTHRSDHRPDYQFTTSRQHWLTNYGDAGVPSGFLRANLNGPDPSLGGPYTAFAASACPQIYFAARYVMSSPPADPHAELFWETNNSGGFSEARKQSVAVIPDGRWRIYTFNVGANAAWSGLISQLRLDPIQSGGAGDYVDIAGISYQNAFSELPIHRAAVADFNGDGHPDYVLQNAATRQTAIWYLNNNVFISGAYGPTLATGWGLRSVADFNHDTHPDYALFAPRTDQTAIWYLSGPTFSGSAYGPTLPSGWELVATADFNGNGYPDYVLYNSGTRRTAIWYLNNSVFVSAAWGPTLPAGWSLLGIADFNRDGRPDYALFNSTTRQTAIWYLSGPTFLRGAYGPSVPSGWALVAMADFNGNGYPDYMLYKASTGQTAIWYLNNNVFVSAAYGPTLPAGWSLVAP